MYLDPQKNLGLYEYYDIETDGLAPSRIWIAVFKNGLTGIRTICLDHQSIREYIDNRPHSIFVGHYSVSFDEPIINRFCHTSIPITRHVDTCVLSYLYNPKLLGGHSLEAYGVRFGVPKVEHEDWTKYSPAMLDRCIGDVAITEMVHKSLSERMTSIGYSEKSCDLEHRIRKIIDAQERNGFGFDVPRARDLRGLLRGRQSDLALEIREAFPPQLEEVGHYKNKRRKNGSDYALLGKHLTKYDEVRFNEDRTEYKTFTRTPFNIGSPPQRVQRLLEAGWAPETFTPKGAPKVDEEALLAFAEASRRGDIALMADWVVLEGRSSMVEGWLNLAKEDPGFAGDAAGGFRIHGKVFSCGARSRRMTHSKPNSANIPSAQNGAKYGRECRELWVAGPERVLVGYDAKSLQMRGFCHYVNNPEVTRLYIEGDPHQTNADSLTQVLGWSVGRGGGGAKTLFYAFLFGAGNKKLGSILGKTDNRTGGKIRKALYGSTNGLERLMEECESEFDLNDGRLVCVDGGYVMAKSANSALNYRIQSLEAVTMKQAAIFIDERAREKGINHKLVGSIHDEGQHEVAPEDANEFGRLACQAITDAGEDMNLNVKLEGDYKVGRTWAETH